MSYTPTILAFAGSARSDSCNKKIVKIAAEGARAAGAKVTELDFRDLPLPLYDGDLEEQEGFPENVLKLKDIMKAHDGFLISSPEYNSSITPMLKNAIDWASRPVEGEPWLNCFADKVAVLMSASPGPGGGMNSLIHVRAILGNINTLVLPDSKSIRNTFDAFNPDDSLKDEKSQTAVENLGAKLAETLCKLKGRPDQGPCVPHQCLERELLTSAS